MELVLAYLTFHCKHLWQRDYDKSMIGLTRTVNVFIRCEAVSEFVLRNLWNWDQRKPSSRWCQRRMRWSVAWSWLRCCCKALWAHGADHLWCHNQSSNNKWLWYSGLPKVRCEEGRAPRGKSIQQLPQTQANLRVIVHLKGTGVSKRSKRYGACVPAGKSRPMARVRADQEADISVQSIRVCQKRCEDIRESQYQPRIGKWAGTHYREQSFYQASGKS